jgi:hypothetical protein
MTLKGLPGRYYILLAKMMIGLPEENVSYTKWRPQWTKTLVKGGSKTLACEQFERSPEVLYLILYNQGPHKSYGRDNAARRQKISNVRASVLGVAVVIK